MIKLTLNGNHESKTFRFDSNEVTIGNERSASADMKLAGDTIQSIHMKILKDGGRFLIINTANDPFTSLNKLPFGKKTLNNLDVIQIGEETITFEIEEESSNQEKEDKPDILLEDDLNLEELDIDLLIQEVEGFFVEEKQPEAPLESEPEPETKQEPIEEKESLPPKKYYLQDFDDEPEHWNDSQSTESVDEMHSQTNSSFKDTIKIIISITVAATLLSALIFSAVYFRASGKNSQEEKKIAAGIGDIAMAMTHAQLNHITPAKQNWADPDFIQNNLSRVLSPSLHTQAQINTHGQFLHYPYILRVYTSSDMSRFLVIAQPIPNLLQWLVHKKTIAIDSATMEIRKINDLKNLNRLLTNPSPLQGKNGEEISRIVREGTLMPLDSLAGNKNHWGFSPPKALSYLRPDAVNFIYNAPRFYPFGEALLKKAVHLSQNLGSSVEVKELQEDVLEISKFTDIVLYTSQGLQNAIEAQKALGTFSPNSRFLVAYVKFNQEGYVASSHLLMNEDHGEVALLNPQIIHEETFPSSDDENEEHITVTDITQDYQQPLQFPIDPNHPLFLQLQAVASSRSRILVPISDEITTTLHRHNLEILPNFDEKFHDLINEYLQIDQMQRKKMVQELATLYQEYSEMPLEEFMQFIEAAKLTEFVNEALKSLHGTVGDLLLTEELIELQIEKIRLSKTFGELDDSVQDTIRLLNLDRLPHPNRLITYQDQMHNEVLKKLSEFLLSPNSTYAKGRLDNQNRTTLVRILKNSWVTDPDEFDYFLTEFDQLKNTARSAG